MTDTLAALVERIDKRLMEVREAGFDDVRVYHADWYQLRDALPVWRPIETAPKDGTVVLLLCKYEWASDVHRNGICVGFFGPANRWDMAITGNYLQSLEIDPTHWMPLPTPPEEP